MLLGGRPAQLGALDEGQHVFSVLARRATGEFYRAEGKSVPFASVSFFVGKKVPPTHKEGSPMLFYTPPERGPAPVDAGPLSIDELGTLVRGTTSLQRVADIDGGEHFVAKHRHSTGSRDARAASAP